MLSVEMGRKAKLQTDLIKKAVEPEDKVLELIKWLEINEERVFKPTDLFFGWKGSFLLIFAVLFGISELLNFIASTNIEKISVMLAGIGVFLAFMAIIVQTGKDNMIDGRMRNAYKLRDFTEREKPLLKALIKIQSENDELKLSILYAMDKETKGETFTEKKLLEILCT
jgi:hypothetical protein